MDNGSTAAKHDVQTPMQSWEESYSQAFNTICEQFWQSSRRQWQLAMSAPVTQTDRRVATRKPPPRQRPKRIQQAARGLSTCEDHHSIKTHTHYLPEEVRASDHGCCKAEAMHGVKGDLSHPLHLLGLCLYAKGIS
ncbi:Hypothetical predicted protein [Pelobates cultripes]|uniref:Uncharacterized protein n=1 Tax=Pelobates cultripes TaxID=61616 RepID=A0AAD1RIS3_PELCU|nr:Hypothetical predicted protein [Pelobates cultripes]